MVSTSILLSSLAIICFSFIGGLSILYWKLKKDFFQNHTPQDSVEPSVVSNFFTSKVKKGVIIRDIDRHTWDIENKEKRNIPYE